MKIENTKGEGSKDENKEKEQSAIVDVTYRYYNSGDILGVVGIHLNNIKHQDGEYTFLVGRTPKYQWIRTVDLFDAREEAEKQPPALFFIHDVNSSTVKIN